jgi:hypothetical protein
MAEHQIVDLAVEGSNPSSHPKSHFHGWDATKWARMAPRPAEIATIRARMANSGLFLVLFSLMIAMRFGY